MLALAPLDNVGPIEIETYTDDAQENEVTCIPRYAGQVGRRLARVNVIAKLPVQFGCFHTRVGHPAHRSRTFYMCFFRHFEPAIAEWIYVAIRGEKCRWYTRRSWHLQKENSKIHQVVWIGSCRSLVSVVVHLLQWRPEQPEM